MVILPDVDAALQEYAPSLKVPDSINALSLLRAFCWVETSGGTQNLPRLERAYAPGGAYYQRSQMLKDDFQKYGVAVSCSWGPLQVMYLVARELGYEGPPWYLADPDAGARVAVGYLNRRVFTQADQLLDIADAYNSGSCRDSIIPAEYCRKLIAAYNAFTAP